VIVLSASAERRWQRAVELVAGVALGVAVADLLIFVAGVGVVQIVAVVAIAMLITVFAGGGGLAVAQAATSAALVVALAPPQGDLSLDRFIDAIIGGAVGLLVMSLVLPHNPLSRVRRAAGETLTQLADAVGLAAGALRAGDAERARRALRLLRAGEAHHQDLADSLTIGKEAATLSPLQWRQRPALGRYLSAAVHIERATRNIRVLARRVAWVVGSGEPVPQELAASLDALALAVRTLRDELETGREPTVARERAVAAVRVASDAYEAGVAFSGSVVVAQVRSAVVDLLRATGLPEDQADRLVEGSAHRPRAGSG
jgi:uncharacterized membrane protein YgaE (UPF0421/DUF939 family)